MRSLLAVLLEGVASFALLALVAGLVTDDGDVATGGFLVLAACFIGLYFTGKKARAEVRRHKAAERAKEEYWISKGKE